MKGCLYCLILFLFVGALSSCDREVKSDRKWMVEATMNYRVANDKSFVLLAMSEADKLGLKWTPTKWTPAKVFTITGDFDGDSIPETYVSQLHDEKGKRVRQIPDFETANWDSFTNFWASLSLSLVRTDSIQDVFRFPAGHSFLCLENVGDNNGDGKDEMAIVLAYAGHGRGNHCNIYSRCENGWKSLFEFWVHEDAFDYKAHLKMEMSLFLRL